MEVRHRDTDISPFLPYRGEVRLTEEQRKRPPRWFVIQSLKLNKTRCFPLEQLRKLKCCNRCAETERFTQPPNIHNNVSPEYVMGRQPHAQNDRKYRKQRSSNVLASIRVLK